MTAIYPYLGLGPTCREAMGFYQTVFGGELSFLKVADTPMASELPKELQDEVMHCELKSPTLRILGTGLQPGSTQQNSEGSSQVSLVLSVKTADETNRYFEALGSGGKVLHPISPTFFAPVFCAVTDKYGVTWSIICEPAE